MRFGDRGENWAALEKEVLVADTGSLVEAGAESSALRELACALGDAAFKAAILGDLHAEAEQVPSDTSAGKAAIDTDHP